MATHPSVPGVNWKPTAAAKQMLAGTSGEAHYRNGKFYSPVVLQMKPSCFQPGESLMAEVAVPLPLPWAVIHLCI